MQVKDLQLKRALRTALLVLLLSVAGMGKVYAQDFTVGELNYSVNSDGISVTVTGHVNGTAATGSLTIPEMVSYEGADYSVTIIGNAAFANCYSFTGDLVIPNSVTSIGANAFAYCTGFTGNLVIGNSVISINSYAFSNCRGFTGNLTIGNSVTTIGYGAFGGCNGFTGFLTIGNSVTSIGNYAFVNCWGFTGDLTIGNSVISIGNSAFTNCSNLSSIEISNSVTYIGNSAFSGCTGLDQIIVEEGNMVYDSRDNCNAIIKTINNELLLGCKNTIIPNSVTSIGDYAFSNCSGLTGDLAIPNSVTTIGSYAFSGCSGLTGNLVIPNSVTSIGANAFAYCTGFTGSLIIGNSVTTLGNSAFSSCSCFETIFVVEGNTVYDSRENCNAIIKTSTNELLLGCKNTIIPNSVMTIGDSAFSGCSGFTGALIIPNSVTMIGNSAFYGCSGITGDLVIPNSVTTIGGYAFSSCYHLTGNLTIGNSVTSIGNDAFSSCMFSSITSLAETPPTLGYNTFGYSYGFLSFSVYVPCGCEDAYASLSWGGFNDFVGLCGGMVTVLANPEEAGSVTGGGIYEANQICTVTATANEGYIFLNWTQNGTVISTNFEYSFYLSDDVTLRANFVSEGNIIFADANVKDICVSHWDTNGDGELSYLEAASVTNLGNYFQGNTEITSFDELHYFIMLFQIGFREFQNCSGLTSLVLPNSVTKINSYAFSGCGGLSGELTIPNSVSWIGYSAFENCIGLTGSLTIPNSVTFIGDFAFRGCSGFTGGLTIGNSVTSIHMGTFAGCNGFTGELIIPNSVSTIEGGWSNGAFESCSGFTSLVLGDSLTIIGKGAFNNCSGFTGNLTIPNSVTEIGEFAFADCSGFTGSLLIPNTVTSIGESAFRRCAGFEAVIIEEDNAVYDSRENSNAIIKTNTNELIFGCKNTIIPNTVITIGRGAFEDCSGLTSIVIPNSVTIIDDFAFYYCTGLTGSFTIPSSVTSIGSYAFVFCSGLTGDLVIPNSVTTIGDAAFASCYGFNGRLTIPNSVTSIGHDAFGAFYSLTEAIIYNQNPPFIGSDAFLYTSFPIYVPYESLNDYKTATNWSSYESRIFPMAYTTVTGYGEGEGNYRFIASPLVENTAPTAVDNMITETEYDLYLFDQTEDDEWRNYKANAEDFVLENGQGYLYANAEDVNLIFKGEFNEDETKEVDLVYDVNADFAGWNLVGNPFPVNAYANKSYYTMNEEGTAIEPNMVSSATAIPACTGVMVMAEAEGEMVVFSTEAPEATTNQGCLQIELSQAVELVETPVNRGDGPSTGSGTLHDKAIMSFNAGDRLEKYVFNKENAVISIPQGGKELAIACSDKQGEVPLNFKASKNGKYTITVNPEAVEMDYLHLIDNMTGKDIDLLASPSYTFNAQTTDYASRFRLVFSASGDADGDNEDFAFVSNNDIIINDEGTVQLIDMAGRIIVSVDGRTRCIPTTGMTSGVYVLRLINGNDVKTQKIVVR